MFLFLEDGMYKGTKSTFYSAFMPLLSGTVPGKNTVEVVDGGYFLHKFYSDHSQCFLAILKNTKSTYQNITGKNAIVFFDSYLSETDQWSKKSVERFQRSRLHTSAEVLFEGNMLLEMPKEKFSGNEMNYFFA